MFSFTLLLFLVLPRPGSAQNVGFLSVPPLQYLHLSPLLAGTGPPGLKDASIGYDETTRSLIIFGGESNGFPQSQTYLLNLDSLTWSLPTPPPNLRGSPPARSSAISGPDAAASNRQSFVVIGGKGERDTPLSDIWAFDWNNQFWSQVEMSPGGPPARWNAVGGRDLRTPPHADPAVPGPNNTFYLFGGTDGSDVLTDGFWTLELAGTLSSNLPNSVVGSWTNTPADRLPSLSSSAGAILSSRIVVSGTCDSSDTSSCPLQPFYILDTSTESLSSFDGCPAPRVGPVIVPNLNTASTSFPSEAFMLFGLYNNASVWDDDGGMERREVAVLDANIGSWARVLPAGDPGSSGDPQYPVPRQGAAAFAFNRGLVGTTRSLYTDTVVFGGQDSEGTYLNDIWLLRSYNDRLTVQNTTFRSGSLATGVNADGTGVSVTFLSSCASRLSNPSSTTTTTSATPTPTSSPGQNSIDPLISYDAPTVHKALSSASAAMVLMAVLGLRTFHGSSPTRLSSASAERSHPWNFLWYVVLAVAWGIGIAGFASAVAGVTAEASDSTSLTRRDAYRPSFLETRHGKAGFAVFLALYIVLPALRLSLAWKYRSMYSSTQANNLSEKDSATIQQEVLPSESPPRAQTLSGTVLSDDSESTSSVGAVRGFEVLNRPHPQSNPGASVYSSASRQLGQVDWLQRRRSVNAVGELDYAISQVLRTNPPSTPAHERLLSDPYSISPLTFPPLPIVLLHLFLHTSILAICLLALTALWFQAPLFAFILFLIWTAAFYFVVFISSWQQLPAISVLSVLIARFRQYPQYIPPPSDQPGHDKIPSSSPYLHTTPAVTDPSWHSPGPTRSMDDDNDDDDDVDEFVHQRRIEEEMDRRQVSIVTVPKRRLWVTNPEPPSQPSQHP